MSWKRLSGVSLKKLKVDQKQSCLTLLSSMVNEGMAMDAIAGKSRQAGKRY